MSEMNVKCKINTTLTNEEYDLKMCNGKEGE